jgi:uncharacterized protein YjbJ (UPF0337 family)
MRPRAPSIHRAGSIMNKQHIKGHVKEAEGKLKELAGA